MNELERQLHYPMGDQLPAAGSTLPITAGDGITDTGIRWIRMALPFALNHINLWLLRDEMPSPSGDGKRIQGWTVVDCCICHDEAKTQWEQIFSNELDGLPILRVIVTHMHPDHIGLAHWLCERWQARLWISGTDYCLARIGAQGFTGFGGGAAAFFASHGLTDAASIEKIGARSNYYAALVPDVPRSFQRIMDGDLIQIGRRQWRCISGYGHAPEHIALYCDELRVLIGGDMMLPRISTNVSVYDMEPEANSLQLFLDSIDKFLTLPADTLGLPAHGKPFTGIHTRVQQLHDHHRDRLAEVMEACLSAPRTAAEVMPILFTRPLDLHQTTFAMGECIAHLHALWFAGKLRRRHGADGIYRFAVN